MAVVVPPSEARADRAGSASLAGSPPRRGCRPPWSEAAVPEQDLDGPEVGAGLQQVGGEAVPQGVDSDVLAQARGLGARLAQTMLHRARGDRPVRDVARGRASGSGRAAFQYSRRTASNRGESITSRSLRPLAWRTRMTIRRLSMSSTRRADDLGDAEPGGVGGHEDGAVLEAGDRLEELRDLVGAEDDGELLLLLGGDDAIHDPFLAEGDVGRGTAGRQMAWP